MNSAFPNRSYTQDFAGSSVLGSAKDSQSHLPGGACLSALPCAADQCLHQLFEISAARTPTACAAVQADRQLSYRELNAKANQLARYLQSCGIGHEQSVAIALAPSLDFAVAVLAVLKAGGACVPLDLNYPEQRLQIMLKDSGARALITDSCPLQGCEELATIHLPSAWPAISTQSVTNLEQTASLQSAAYIIYTSGSTGTPKGVVLTHRGLANHSAAAVELYGLTEGDRMLQFSSISFDIAIEELFPTWTAGAAVVFKDAANPLGFVEFANLIEKQSITVLDLPTAYWQEWTNQLFDAEAELPGSLRLVIVGGEKASASVLRRWQSRAGKRVRWINTYGPTEASVIATAYEPEGLLAPDSTVPIGRPIANTRVYLLDESLNPVAPGTAGELYIGGVGVARGYLNRPELTAERFLSDPFNPEPNARMYRTGDMAKYRGDGEIEFLGRADNQVKIRGFRVEPGEIEETLLGHAAVREAVVVARETEAGDKRLVAYIVAGAGQAVDNDDLRRHLQSCLPDYMMPSQFVTLEAMPLTANGKLDRRGLPDPGLVFGSVSSANAGSSDPVQKELLQIWKDVLGRPVGVHDNFFELGGHSLLAARLMHRIGQVKGQTLPLALLFQAPTVEQLARVLQQQGWSRHWSSLIAIQPRGNRPPFFCVHGVGGNVVGFRDLGGHLAPEYPFYGLQSQGLDGRSPCLRRVEDMAAHYLREIRKVQPQGPYLLGGFSFGGLVAYEMAQQLRAAGESVSLLALLDTSPVELRPASSALLQLLRRPSRKALLQDVPRAFRKNLRRQWRRVTIPRALKQVFSANSQAAREYRPQPYEGQVTLFRATEKSLRHDDDDSAWRQLAAGGLELESIPGDHGSILVEPQVGMLAQRLQHHIDRVALYSETAARSL